MLRFLKYFLLGVLHRISRTAFYVGLIITVVFSVVLYPDIRLSISGDRVTAEVIDVQSFCTARWREVNLSGETVTRTTGPIDCGRARQLPVTNPTRLYEIEEGQRTHLAYTAPDGSRSKTVSDAFAWEDPANAVRGRIVTAFLDTENPGRLLPPPESEDLLFKALTLTVSVVAMIAGWLLSRLVKRQGLTNPLTHTASTALGLRLRRVMLDRIKRLWTGNKQDARPDPAADPSAPTATPHEPAVSRSVPDDGVLVRRL